MIQTGDRLQALQHEAHVWFIAPECVTDAALLARYAAELSADERARLARFKFDRDRHLFLVSHALVRRVLSTYTAVDPAAWQFSPNPHGRPEIAGPAIDVPLRFNLTHTDGLAACIVTAGDDCGIDAEKLCLPANPQAIAEKMFAKPEQLCLSQLSQQAFQERFFIYWTLRESYCKAVGLGFSMPMEAFHFECDGNNPFSIRLVGSPDTPGDSWQFTLLSPTPEHLASVAIRVREPRVKRIVEHWLEPHALDDRFAGPSGLAL